MELTSTIMAVGQITVTALAVSIIVARVGMIIVLALAVVPLDRVAFSALWHRRMRIVCLEDGC